MNTDRKGATTMNSTTTRHELTRTPVSVALSEVIFGGASNPYYADSRTRLIFGYFETNAHGEHVARIAVARSIDYAGNARREPLISHGIAASPVFTSTSDCHDWIDAAQAWAVVNLVQPHSLRDFPVERATHSHCSRCGHFDTLTVKQMAYGDLTTCTTEGCDFESYYSIGD